MDNSYRNVIPSTGNMTYTILGNTGSVIPSDHKIAQKNSFVLGLVWLRTCGIVLARTLPRKQLLTGLSVVPSPFFPFLSIFSSGFITGSPVTFSFNCVLHQCFISSIEKTETHGKRINTRSECARQNAEELLKTYVRGFTAKPPFLYGIYDGRMAMLWFV